MHDEPEEEKLQELRETMSTYGVKCGKLTTPQGMSALLQQLKDHPRLHPEDHVLRSLKQAQYRASPDGHYGLAKQDYTHFTSPIRRYSDLIVHRVFDAYLHKHGIDSAPTHPDANYALGKLESIADHLCVTERNSVDAERESVKTKLLEFYERQLKKALKQPFDAVITDIKNHGLYNEITDSMAFGMVHISTLDDDFYHPSSDGKKLTGRKTGTAYAVADDSGTSRARRSLQAPDRLSHRPRDPPATGTRHWADSQASPKLAQTPNSPPCASNDARQTESRAQAQALVKQPSLPVRIVTIVLGRSTTG